MKNIQLLDGKVDVIKSETVLSLKTLRIVQLTERHQKYDGSQSVEFMWSLCQRKPGVTVVIHCTTTDEILLVEQFRPATLLPPFLTDETVFVGNGRTLELVAGGLGNEDPEDCARREAVEEAGIELSSLTKIGEFYLSPGVTNEKIISYYAPVSSKEFSGVNCGLVDENEDTLVHWVKLSTAKEMILSGEIDDVKTRDGIMWLLCMKK